MSRARLWFKEFDFKLGTTIFQVNFYPKRHCLSEMVPTSALKKNPRIFSKMMILNESLFSLPFPSSLDHKDLHHGSSLPY